MMKSGRPTAEEILRDLGAQPRLTIYVGYAPGGGKTHRLLTEAQSLKDSGVNVALGWIETKGRADLEALAAGLQRIPPRKTDIGGSTFEDLISTRRSRPTRPSLSSTNSRTRTSRAADIRSAGRTRSR
jgi:K+-sensing histidine kinase KdpD